MRTAGRILDTGPGLWHPRSGPSDASGFAEPTRNTALHIQDMTLPPPFRELAARVRAAVGGAAQARKGDARKSGWKERPESAKQGEWGERKAEEWLVRNAGLKTIGRRVKVSRDEFDLIMEERSPRGRMIVFVEVKTRKNRLYGGGFAAVDRRKRHALCRAAVRWMQRIEATPFRIDVVCVYGDCREDRVDRIDHQKRAVPLERRYDALALHRHARR